MRIKDNLILKELGNEYVVVPTGEGLVDFKFMITINDTGAFLWSKLQNETSEAELIRALTSEYDIDTEIAENDVKEFIQILKSKELIEE